MKKRIVVCADGTWNRPEKNLKEDVPSNVLRLARAIKPTASDSTSQQVFYDWGLGSYHDEKSAGATGKGIQKNIMDGYRYIVQNYSPGDELFLFGFSRGAYTVRSLCGLINNVGILKRPDAKLIQKAFDHYKKPGKRYSPEGDESTKFRGTYAHPSRRVKFVGLWDTVGALGIPIPFIGMMERKDEFYDSKMGPNVSIARHALAIDDRREFFEPTILLPREGLDLKQVWFVGSHSDVGGGYKPDKGGSLLADIALDWMIKEVKKVGLTLESHLKRNLGIKPTATLHDSSKEGVSRTSPVRYRPIDHGHGKILIHRSVKQRWNQDPSYRPENLKAYLKKNGNRWPTLEG